MPNENKIHIQNESGDHLYFTQIPNMVVNHSSAYEQSLYLQMKRIAGETGSCYASLNFLAQKMKVDKNTVSKTIDKLLQRKWLKEIEKKVVKGGSVRQFIIVDLWKLNVEVYESGRQITTSKEVDATSPGSGSIITGSGSINTPLYIKKNYKKIYKEDTDFYKKNLVTPVDNFTGIDDIIAKRQAIKLERSKLQAQGILK